MSEVSDAAVHELTCPHCRRPFTAELMQGTAARYSGFKCPHCKLFVPLERTADTDPPQAA